MTGSQPAAPAAMTLRAVGLRVDEAVRFRRRADERWRDALVVARQRDGSVGLRDANGAFCAIVIEGIEVRAVGPRGHSGWEPLTDRIGRAEQLELF